MTGDSLSASYDVTFQEKKKQLEKDKGKEKRKKKRKTEADNDEEEEEEEEEEEFHIFCVEDRLTVAHRPNCQGSSTNTGTLYPALVFKPLIDKIDLFKTKKLPVEFLSDNKLVFQEYSGLKTVTVSEERDNIPVSDSRTDCSNQSKSEFEMLLRQLSYAP